MLFKLYDELVAGKKNINSCIFRRSRCFVVPYGTSTFLIGKKALFL